MLIGIIAESCENDWYQ